MTTLCLRAPLTRAPGGDLWANLTIGMMQLAGEVLSESREGALCLKLAPILTGLGACELGMEVGGRFGLFGSTIRSPTLLTFQSEQSSHKNMLGK